MPLAGCLHRVVAGLGLLAVLSPTTAYAIDWPQQITADEGSIVVYQPQPESLDGNVLIGRAAMELQPNGQDDPVFGAFWFTARIDTDSDAGTATIRDLKVTKVRWPESTDANEQRFTAVVQARVPKNGFEISMERLSASLEDADIQRRSLENLKSDPPDIVFEQHLAVLLLFDGMPRFKAIDGSPYERALNTPFLVARNASSKRCYLSSGTFWYTAAEPLGPWSVTDKPPADLVAMIEKDRADQPQDPENPAGSASPPGIVVATRPTELIVSDGAPDWQSLPGGGVLYVRNTETPWLRELATGNMYLLLSGRWFRAKSASGPWTFVPATELPEDFAKIPPDSDLGGVRASIAGTTEADDALLDAQIPQTAAIDRSKATVTVSYDGKPKFERIPGTEVSYAVNTGSQVLEIGDRYYAVDNGVWFSAAAAAGPWEVADSVPESQIAKIPPSSPVYNTAYVHIYESTPDVVYVGYTPGYLWSFPYYGVPVYGTGWYYPPYWGSFYYPRPPTWGLHVGYNPWTGWNFGVSWSNGFFTLGMSWGAGWGPYRPWGCCGGWYGGGYRGPVVINTGDINIGNRINIGNTINAGNTTRIGNAIAERSGATPANLQGGRNLYDRSQNRSRNAEPALTRSSLTRARPATGRANDVFTDRQGNVARRTGEGWQTRSGGQWQTADTRRELDRNSIDRGSLNRGSFDRSGFEHAHGNRMHGTSRENMRGRVQGFRGRR